MSTTQCRSPCWSSSRGGSSATTAWATVVADRLRDVVGPAGVVGRIGGDEFAVLCHDDPAGDRSRRVAERITAAFSAPIDGVERTIGTSVGVAVAAASGTTPEALIEAADRDMYATRAARMPASWTSGALTVDDLYPVAELRRSLRQIRASVDDAVSFELLDVAYAAERALAVLEGSPGPGERIPPR